MEESFRKFFFFMAMLYYFTIITLIISPTLIKLFCRRRMSLELNACKWWEWSGDKLWAINLRRPNFVAQDDESHRRGGNQPLGN